MDYDQKTAVEKLQNFLNQHKRETQEQGIDHQALEADIRWGAARFWALALHTAGLPGGRTRPEAEAFQQQYNIANGTHISIQHLFDKHWLREILDRVRVASNIASAVRSFAEIRSYKEELLFIKDLQTEQASKEKITLTAPELEAAIVQYENTRSVPLKREGVLHPKWSASKDGRIGITPLKQYYGLYLDHWDELEFLFHWLASEEEPEKGLPITREEIETLRSRFTKIVPPPTISTFLKQEVIYKGGNQYYLKFWATKPDYWSGLSHQIAGLLWEELLHDKSCGNDEQRVFIFLQKIIRWQRWPNHLDHVTPVAKKRFLDAALKLLVSQPDLNGIANEFSKLRLDSESYRGIEALRVLPGHEIENHLVSGADLFDVYHSLHGLEDKADITYLHHQAARIELTFLVRTLVKYDDEYARPGRAESSYFNRVVRLLREGATKPFFLWKVTRFIVSERPEMIAYLLTQHDLSTLGLSLIDELEFADNSISLNHQAWLLAVELLLKFLPEAEDNEALLAKTVFQTFFQLNHKKYTLSFSRTLKDEQIGREAQRKKESDVLTLLENARGAKGRFVGSEAPYLIPTIFGELADLFIHYSEYQRYRNGTMQFPMLKWDGMFWLQKVSSYWKYKTSLAERKQTVSRLTNAFLDQYLHLLEQKEVDVYDYFEGQSKKATPLWSEKIERLELLDWFYPVYGLAQVGKLSGFLSPRFQFEETTEKYNSVNLFNADKLRTHLGVLLQVMRRLVVHTIPYNYEKEKIEDIRRMLENKIFEYIPSYISDKPEEGQVDVLSYNKEWMHQRSDKEALLPKLAQAINWFENKQRIINAIVENGDLIKWLILLEYVTAEGIRKFILDRITQMNLFDFLRGLGWLTEVKMVLVKISHYPQLIAKFEEVLRYWEELVAKKDSRENKEQLYLSRLLLSFFKGNADELEQVPLPDPFDGRSIREMGYSAQKDFYRALLHINSNPQEAYTILSRLVHIYTHYPVLGMNRMVAKMNIAAATNSSSLYWEAYEEWQTARNTYYKDEDLSFLEPDLSANLMEILHHLRNIEKQDKLFDSLDLANKMVPAIITIRVKSLVEAQRKQEALSLVETAKHYHQFAEHTELQFLNDLETEIRGLDNVDELRMQYNRIFASTPGKLVQILPDSFNDQKDLVRFLVKEIVLAAGKLLEKIKSIEEIGLEDKYNDLIELVLDARLNGFKWQVGAQSRGGFSAPKDGGSGKQPGERDLPVFDANKNLLLNCEAFIYHGASNTPSHLQKVFNSHHQKEAFVILIYDTGEEKKGFEGNWKEYCDNHVKNTPYPYGSEITMPMEEITHEFGCNGSAIKVGKTEHGGLTILYHVFVNIRYHVPLPKIPPAKRGRKSKSTTPPTKH